MNRPKPAYCRRAGAVWRVRAARDHARYRRAGRAKHCGDYLLFWLKEDLYLACAEWIADFIGTQFHPHVEEATALLGQPSPDREAIRELILNACHNMIRVLTHDDTLNLSKFISREQLSPLPPISGYTIGSLPRCIPT